MTAKDVAFPEFGRYQLKNIPGKEVVVMSKLTRLQKSPEEQSKVEVQLDLMHSLKIYEHLLFLYCHLSLFLVE